MDSFYLLFSLVVLIMSSVVHEYMHGWMANELGDNTAKMLGRLTLNPLAHLDPMGSFLLPALIFFGSGGSFIFGYAKPVPYNPLNLKDFKYGPAKVAAAGPLSNLAIAVLCGLLLRFLPGGGEMFLLFLSLIIQINLILMVFNLIPLPPLDGSRILAAFLPAQMQIKYFSLERFGLFLALILVIFAFPVILMITNLLFKIIVGI